MLSRSGGASCQGEIVDFQDREAIRPQSHARVKLAPRIQHEQSPVHITYDQPTL